MQLIGSSLRLELGSLRRQPLRAFSANSYGKGCAFATGAYMDLVLNVNMKSLEERMKLDRKNWIKFEDVVKQIKDGGYLMLIAENKRLRRENERSEQEQGRFRREKEQLRSAPNV